MHIILMRHADAGDADSRRYPDDGLRPLTSVGEREHRLLVQGLARMGVGATHVLTSPLRRARETAEITARGLAVPGVIESVDALGDRFTVGALLEHLQRYPAQATVLCVGHEPHLSRFAAALLHADAAVRIAVPKSGVIGLECAGQPAPGAARLLWALPPRELLRLLVAEPASP